MLFLIRCKNARITLYTKINSRWRKELNINAINRKYQRLFLYLRAGGHIPNPGKKSIFKSPKPERKRWSGLGLKIKNVNMTTSPHKKTIPISRVKNKWRAGAVVGGRMSCIISGHLEINFLK